MFKTKWTGLGSVALLWRMRKRDCFQMGSNSGVVPMFQTAWRPGKVGELRGRWQVGETWLCGRDGKAGSAPALATVWSVSLGRSLGISWHLPLRGSR